jgi:hypothetical protein
MQRVEIDTKSEKTKCYRNNNLVRFFMVIY